MDRTKVIRWLVICALLMGLTAFTFWPVLHSDFVNFDDNSYVTQNPYVLGGLSASDIAWAFKTAYFGNWHPITWLSHMLDVEIFGLNPSYHHLTNLLLHICNTCLLFWFLAQATARTWPSAIVAALFAVHPLHVESVAWVSERKDVLSTFFGFLSLLAYLRYVRNKRESQCMAAPRDGRPPRHSRCIPWFTLSLLCFALGLMSKAMIVTLPFVMLLLDFWPLRRVDNGQGRREEKLELQGSVSRVQGFLLLLREKLPFVALTVFFTIISSRALALTSESHFESSQVNFIANAFVSYMRYLGKTFWPVNLSAFYPRLTSVSIPQVALSAATVILLSVTASCLARRRPYIFVGWFWFLGALVPVIGLPYGDHSMADRYTYVPLIGIFIAIIWGLAAFIGESRSRAVPGASGAGGSSIPTNPLAQSDRLGVKGSILLAALTTGAILIVAISSFLSRHQLKYWRSSKDLLEHVLAVSGDSAMAHNNLGALLASQDDWPAAEKHFAQAARLQPGLPAPKVNLAKALAHEGKSQEAIEQLAGLNSAWEAEGHRQLAEIFLADMKTNAALEQYTSAVQLAPTDAAMRETLGFLLANCGKIPEATEQFTALVQLKPDAQSHYHLALSLLIQGKAEESIAHYSEAIRLKPDWPEPLNDLAWLLATYPRSELRNGHQAVELAERACRLANFREARFLGTLDAAYAESGRFPEAITAAEQAKSLALAADNKTIADLADERLKLYRSGLPFHQQ
jgi:tetratricopeptide (TPR) repeat protein